MAAYARLIFAQSAEKPNYPFGQVSQDNGLFISNTSKVNAKSIEDLFTACIATAAEHTPKQNKIQSKEGCC